MFRTVCLLFKWDGKRFSLWKCRGWKREREKKRVRKRGWDKDRNRRSKRERERERERGTLPTKRVLERKAKPAQDRAPPQWSTTYSEHIERVGPFPLLTETQRERESRGNLYRIFLIIPKSKKRNSERKREWYVGLTKGSETCLDRVKRRRDTLTPLRRSSLSPFPTFVLGRVIGGRESSFLHWRKPKEK